MSAPNRPGRLDWLTARESPWSWKPVRRYAPMANAGSRQYAELLGQIRRRHIRRLAHERHSSALQRPRDQGNAALLATVRDLEPIPGEDGNREQEKSKPAIALPEAGSSVMRRPGTVGGGQVEI